MSQLTKAEVRRLMLRRRARLPKALRHELSRRICRQVLAHRWLHAAEAVHLYCSFGSEVETEELRGYLLTCGKRVAVPILVPGETELRHVWLQPGVRFRLNRRGIPEPVTEPTAWLTAEALGLRQHDLILVPVLAFDRQLYRLGYGGGYYDRFLGRVPARRLGLAFSFQAVETLPHDAHDVPLDAVVTEEGVLERGDTDTGGLR